MFLSQTDAIVGEEKAMILHELEEYQSGLLMIVFETIDRVSHMFWRYIDKESPLYDAEGAKKYGGVIQHYYEDMDKTLGEIMKHVDDKTLLLVTSDHGFTNFRRAVHLNSWLRDQGLQNLKTDTRESRALFRDVDWSKTKAYAVGLGSIYINLEGRESQGIVASGEEKTQIEKEIISSLEQLMDPKNGKRVVHKVYRREEIFSGSKFEKMPDLVVGFSGGYRVSWQTALGAAPREQMEDNMKKWSGDHIVEPSLVPGVFFSNRKLDLTKQISLYDIAPTILQEFGITPPKEFLGKPIFDRKAD
jgi:predicted AlkP superfamily phosphohydrolase/phosphomutase